MRLTNVDNQKLHAVVVLCVQITETHRLLDERRSGETPENKRHRFFTPEVRKTYRMVTIGIPQFKSGGDVSGLWCKWIVMLMPSSGIFTVLNGFIQCYSPGICCRSIFQNRQGDRRDVNLDLQDFMGVLVAHAAQQDAVPRSQFVHEPKYRASVLCILNLVS